LPVLAIFGKSHGDQTRRLSQGESVSAVPILLFARGNGQAFPIDSGRVATGAHVPQRREPLWHGAASENYLSSGLCARPAAAKPSGKRGSADTINEVYGCESTSDFSANWPDNGKSCDEPPTRILYVPGSASQRCLVVLKNAKERWSNSRVILFDSPGRKNTFQNPFSSLMGRSIGGTAASHRPAEPQVSSPNRDLLRCYTRSLARPRGYGKNLSPDLNLHRNREPWRLGLFVFRVHARDPDSR
jgi:hypothetical protein